MKDIGMIIKNRRLALGLTLEQVGDAVGVGKSTVRKWENGMIANMKRDRIAALAAVLRMSPADLIDLDQDEPFTPEPEDTDRLEALHQDPRLCLLFDRARKMSSEDVDFMLQFAGKILKERDGE